MPPDADKIELLRSEVGALHKDVTTLNGKVDTLTHLLSASQAQVNRVEGRQWTSTWTALLALVGAILSFIFRNGK